MSAAKTTDLNNEKYSMLRSYLDEAIELHGNEITLIDPSKLSFEELYKEKNKAHKKLRAMFGMVIQEIISNSEFSIQKRIDNT